VPELGSLGSVRGALRNERPYREHLIVLAEDSPWPGQLLSPSYVWVFILPPQMARPSTVLAPAPPCDSGRRARSQASRWRRRPALK
jgi:hypothetical protein